MTRIRSRSSKSFALTTLTILALVTIINASIIYLVPDERTKTVLIDLIYPLWNLIATVCLVIAAWRSTAHSRGTFLAWTFLALGQLAFTIADVIWAWLELGIGKNPFPSAADGFYLAFYPLILIGILFLPARRLERQERTKLLLDTGIIMIAATLVYWIFLINPLIMDGAGSSMLTQIITLAYPVGDLILFAAVLKLLYRRPDQQNQTALFLLSAGIAVMILTDTIYGYQAIAGTYVSGGVLDLGWPIYYALIGIAGFWQVRSWQTGSLEQNHSPKRYFPQTEGSFGRLNPREIYFPYFWVAAVFVLLLYQLTQAGSRQVLLMWSGFGAIVSLVIIRQILTLRENEQLVDQLQETLSRMSRQSAEFRAEIQKRKMMQEQLDYDSLHDGLTGLANRSLLMDRLKQAIEYNRRRTDYGYAVILMDIDYFKNINEALGHSIGDQLLLEVSQRLKLSLRTSDTLARLGGDEFVLLLLDANQSKDAAATIERITQELTLPYQIGEHKIQITASFGVVTPSVEYIAPEEILRDADIAMYCAKAEGKANYVFFHPNMREKTITRLKLRNELPVALERGELCLNFQPIFDLRTGRIQGLEALLRWQHPEKGRISPLEFIPIAEETGLIHPIGRWVLLEACRKMCQWHNAHPRSPTLTISVNVSGLQIKSPDFIEQVRQVLQETGLAASRLILEITEGIFLDHSETITTTFNQLTAMGVRLQIDDFGTGYSSLTYIQEFPVHTIKLDRAFVSKIGIGNASEIVRTIITMAHDMGKETIAEGIETEEQLNFLKKLGCEGGQGFLLSLPHDSNGIEKLLQKNLVGTETAFTPIDLHGSPRISNLPSTP